MKRYFRHKAIKLLAALAGILGGAWAIGAAWDTYQVLNMTEKMKTICVGRMLIDLPAEAQVELYGQWIDGFDVDTFAESQEAFKARVAGREAEIQGKPDRLGGRNNMELAREIHTASGLMGKIFVHTRKVSEGTEGYSAETLRHYRYEGVALEAHLHGHGLSIDVSAKEYDPALADNLPKLVSQLIPNPANRIPTDPGFCIDRAYIRDPLSAEQGERITMAVKLPSHPDIGINFDTIAGTKPDPRGLLERNAASRARLPALLNMRVTDLRAAPRVIGGLRGDELAQRVIEDNLSIVYGFHWEMVGTEDSVFIPDLALTMVTGRGEGEPIRSSLSEPAAMALWDRISSSIRVRPAGR
jgi:hypothetical protein